MTDTCFGITRVDRTRVTVVDHKSCAHDATAVAVTGFITIAAVCVRARGSRRYRCVRYAQHRITGIGGTRIFIVQFWRHAGLADVEAAHFFPVTR
jgi:hypothetical protein